MSEALTRDAFLGGRLNIWQPAKGYRGGTDPVFLAAACPARAGDHVLELGCGTGIAALCLLARVPDARVTGLEVLADHANLARRNALENEMDLTVIEGDVGHMPEALRAQSFDHVILNPPYFPAGGGTAARDEARETALREALPLATWIDAGIKRLAPKGSLTVIARADRLLDITGALDDRVGDVRLLPIVSREGLPAGRVLLRATKGARAAPQMLWPFVVHGGATPESDGPRHTPEAESVLRDARPLKF